MPAATDYEAFRAEVRDFALTQCPAELRALVASYRKLERQELDQWQKLLFERGWGAPGWPVAHGGTGWDLRQRIIFEEEMADCDCPPQPHQGLRHIGPVLIEFGTPDQQARFLPRILSGQDYWCQGYSEPGAGSDLASLKTRARREGDDYIIDGQKTWTTGAHESDMMFALVRTSTEARKQDGITMLLVPMNTPGIQVRPIRTIDGFHPHVNEVFLDAVRVPSANRIGEEGKGWRYAKFLLDRERLGPVHALAAAGRFLDRARELVATELAGENQVRKRETLELRLLMAEAEIVGLREQGRQAIDDLMQGRPLGVTPSLVKLGWSAASQTITETAFDAVGQRLAGRVRPMESSGPDAAAPEGLEWVQNFFYYRARTIFGGSSEVQKNLIARDLFGA
ncbi:MAG: acyl-CoA dehydrogenase [Belnapia sp.]|nr:acyl-CoA dehydrogenase [Belnapia sp.]